MEPISTKKENSNSEPRVLSASNQGNQETKANQTPLLFVNETKNKIASQEEEEEEKQKLPEENKNEAKDSEYAVVKLKLIETNITKLKTLDTTRADTLAFTKSKKTAIMRADNDVY